MSIFSIVFFKIISILLSVITGFLAGKFAKVQRDSIATLVFYFVAPIVFFATPASAALNLKDVSIMLLVIMLSTILCFTAYNFFGLFWKDTTRNILALSAGDANAGYFSLPIAAALFDEETLSIYMMAIIGVNIYESSAGFYAAIRGTASGRDSIKRVLQLPTLNAFIAGSLFSILGFTLPVFLDDFVSNMQIVYSILGMMMIGLGLSSLKGLTLDLKFTAAALVSKFIFYPSLIGAFILLDKYVLKIYGQNYYNALILFSTTPLAANIIVIGSIVKFNPEVIATAVLISLLVVLVYMPVMLSIFLS